ncbi:MAG: hypothetical protein IT406_02295 [Candidatus Yanofskybacteria bacterium]|nr:hypothetical protein [Candidatus Yanofskybacteria bacterium]
MQNIDAEGLTTLVKELTEYLQIPCDVAVSTPESGPICVSVRSDEHGRLLIGKGGQNLKALEHIIRMMWMRKYPEQRAITVDVNDYHAERAQELVAHVRNTAERVRVTGKSEALNPMSPYERRIVHTELASYSDLTTESVGQEPHRRVVIKPL